MSFQGQTLYWNGWSDWYETKRRCIGWILGELCDLDLWPHSWPWPCSFKVKVWNSLIWGMRRLIDMERKGCESIIHDHDCDLWVTMVGWVDAPYSDWGDFRRRRAVDISISLCYEIVYNINTQKCLKSYRLKICDAYAMWFAQTITFNKNNSKPSISKQQNDMWHDQWKNIWLYFKN